MLSRSDCTSCLMLLTTGSGKPVRSRICKSSDNLTWLAMKLTYRNEARSVKNDRPTLTNRPERSQHHVTSFLLGVIPFQVTFDGIGIFSLDFVQRRRVAVDLPLELELQADRHHILRLLDHLLAAI